MTKQVEVIASVQRRRRWPRAEKERIVAAAMEPGAVASDVARAAGIHVSQLFRWRQQLCNRRAAPAFAAVTVSPQASPGGLIEVEFATGVVSVEAGQSRANKAPLRSTAFGTA
jgi:transposase